MKRDYTPKSANRGDVDAALASVPRRCNFQHTPVLKLACADLRGMKRSLKQVPRVPEQTPNVRQKLQKALCKEICSVEFKQRGGPINLATWVTRDYKPKPTNRDIWFCHCAGTFRRKQSSARPCTCKVQRDLGKMVCSELMHASANNAPLLQHVAPAPERAPPTAPLSLVRKARRVELCKDIRRGIELQHVVPVPERAPNIRQKQQRRLCEELRASSKHQLLQHVTPVPERRVTAPASLMTKVIKRGQLMNQQSARIRSVAQMMDIGLKVATATATTQVHGATIAVKTQLVREGQRDDIRRMTVATQCSFETLLATVITVYGGASRLQAKLLLAWRDEEGDYINVRTRMDWEEAVTYATTLGKGKGKGMGTGTGEPVRFVVTLGQQDSTFA